MKSRKHKRILEECLSFLSVNNVPVDEQLRLIIEYFFSADHHLSIADIQKVAQDSNLPISSASIGKIMKLLVEYGFAIEKIFGDNVTRYEHLHHGEHHDHFYCLKCGKIAEFYSQVIEDAQLQEAQAHGFRVFSHKMQIHGLCDRCFGKSSLELIPLSMVMNGGRFRIAGLSSQTGAFGSGHGARRRIMELGLAPGIEGEVIANHGGRLVVFCDGNRIAFGKGLGQRLMVVLLN